MASSDLSAWLGPLATGLAGMVVGAVLATAGQNQDTKTVTLVRTVATADQAPSAAPQAVPAPKQIAAPAATAPETAEPRVDGTFSLDCGIIGGCTSPDAADRLETRRVWCQWRGDRVAVHAVLTNGMNARVKLSIVPKYFIDKGGQHGPSFGSDIALQLHPHATKEWTGDAGHPEGVPTGTPISSCEPQLQNIDIG